VLRVPEEEEEIHDMKNRMRAGRIVATVVASLALAFGVSAPASASPGFFSNILNCPNFMVARLSFKPIAAGRIEWRRPGSSVNVGVSNFSKSTTTRSFYAPVSGPVQYYVGGAYTTSVYATCSV
jgi:hypothetical protein